MGIREALDILGAPARADATALKGAFNAAVKSAHPDRMGGDERRLRLVIEAYQLLRPRPPAPKISSASPPSAPAARAETLAETKRRRFAAAWAA